LDLFLIHRSLLKFYQLVPTMPVLATHKEYRSIGMIDNVHINRFPLRKLAIKQTGRRHETHRHAPPRFAR
jgi:hypothetical protein